MWTEVITQLFGFGLAAVRHWLSNLKLPSDWFGFGFCLTTLI